MNEEQFLQALAEAKEFFRWSKVHSVIRGYLKAVGINDYTGCYCLITAVCRFKTGLCFASLDYKKAAIKLGLPIPLAHAIASATDELPPYNKVLRKRLIAAIN